MYHVFLRRHRISEDYLVVVVIMVQYCLCAHKVASVLLNRDIADSHCHTLMRHDNVIVRYSTVSMCFLEARVGFCGGSKIMFLLDNNPDL